MSSTGTVIRPALAAAVVVAVATSLTGCFLLPKNEPASDDYFSQELEFTDCGEGFRCADVTVPVDWSDLEGDSVTVAMVVHPAGAGSMGPLFTNPGGPGASGIEMVLGGYAASDALIEKFDIVGWDPRGVG